MKPTRQELERALGYKLYSCHHWRTKPGYGRTCRNPLQDDFCPDHTYCPERREEYVLETKAHFIALAKEKK